MSGIEKNGEIKARKRGRGRPADNFLQWLGEEKGGGRLQIQTDCCDVTGIQISDVFGLVRVLRAGKESEQVHRSVSKEGRISRSNTPKGTLRGGSSFEGSAKNDWTARNSYSPPKKNEKCSTMTRYEMEGQ